MVGRGRPAGSHDITPEIRGAWKRACLIVEERGKSLSELIAAAIEKDVVTALKAIQGFLPRESSFPIAVQINGETLSEKAAAVLELGATGQLTVPELSALMQMVSTMARIIDVDELERRITTLEQAK